MTMRVDGVQGNPDDPKRKRVIHKLTDEEKKAGSVFIKETTVGMGENNSGRKFIFNYKDLNGDGLITEDELQSKTDEKYNTKHQKIQSNVFKDVNRDGELDLYMIDKYSYNDDGTASVNRYKDINGDGYSDEYTKYEYDKNMKLLSKETKVEKEIPDFHTTDYNTYLHETRIRNMGNLYLQTPASEKTEVFIDSLIPKILQTQSKKPAEVRRSYLNKLVGKIQGFNGSIKNNLSDKVKEVGSPEQIEIYNRRIMEHQKMILDYASFAKGVEAIQNPETKLYQLKIGNEIIDVPERKVKLGEYNTEDGIELLPVIDD